MRISYLLGCLPVTLLVFLVAFFALGMAAILAFWYEGFCH